MIEDDIWALLSKATAKPIVFANQNGPRPPLPYIALRLDRAPASNLTAWTVREDGTQDHSAHRDGIVELQCFGAGSFDTLDDMAQRLRGPAMVAEAAAANLAIYTLDSVMNIPVLRDGTTYEPRAVLEIGIRYTRTHTEDVGAIDTVHGDMTLIEGDKQFVSTFQAP